MEINVDPDQMSSRHQRPDDMPGCSVFKGSCLIFQGIFRVAFLIFLGTSPGYPSLVLAQPRKTRPYMTERLLMGC